MEDTSQPQKDGEPEAERASRCTPDNATSSFGMTLEEIIDASGEFEHLNQLVVLEIKRSGGLKSPDDYFAIVTPILDLLEREIRVRSVQGITKQQMKQVIQSWIDNEMAGIK